MNAANAAKVAAVTAKLTGEATGGYAAPLPVPAWKRALRRLFPREHVAVPDHECYALYTIVHAHLDWKDRLRVLVSGHVLIETRTITDVRVSKTQSASAVSILAPGENA